MSTWPPCPKCKCEYTYEHGTMIVCPECAHEWSPGAGASDEATPAGLVVGDHNIDCRIDGFGAMKLKSEFVKMA
jgi:protein PhnA